MSDKNTLLAKEQATLDAAIAGHATRMSIIKGLPDGIPMPMRITNSGFCADFTLLFEFTDYPTFATLIKAFPPEPTVVIRGYTIGVKPAAYVRPASFDDSGVIRRIFPVFVVQQGAKPTSPEIFKWWTIHEGHSVQIECTYGDLAAVHKYLGSEINKYFNTGYSYATGNVRFYQLRQKQASDLGLQTPLDRWCATWDDWAADNNITAAQMVFIKIFRNQVKYSPADADLDLDGQLPTGQRVAAYWESFDQAQTVHLAAFMAERHLALAAVKLEQAQCVERASTWLSEFFSTKGSPFAGGSNVGANNMASANTATFDYLFHKETGLAGDINWVSDLGNRNIEVAYTIDKEHVRVRCRSLIAAQDIDWEALAEFY